MPTQQKRNARPGVFGTGQPVVVEFVAGERLLCGGDTLQTWQREIAPKPRLLGHSWRTQWDGDLPRETTPPLDESIRRIVAEGMAALRSELLAQMREEVRGALSGQEASLRVLADLEAEIVRDMALTVDVADGSAECDPWTIAREATTGMTREEWDAIQAED